VPPSKRAQANNIGRIPNMILKGASHEEVIRVVKAVIMKSRTIDDGVVTIC
jgi:hypothetical protein